MLTVVDVIKKCTNHINGNLQLELTEITLIDALQLMKDLEIEDNDIYSLKLFNEDEGCSGTIYDSNDKLVIGFDKIIL